MNVDQADRGKDYQKYGFFKEKKEQMIVRLKK
jgi:hypothetical protein